MLKEFQYIYGGTRLIRVTGSTESIGRIEAIAGTIKAIAVRAENVGSVGSFVFNVRKNGAALLSGSDKLTVNSGAKRAEKTDADFGEITTLKGDLLSFAMDEVGAGGILGDLIFTITIDDGVSGGADSAEEISVDNSTFVVIEGEDVQAALEEIFVSNSAVFEPEVTVFSDIQIATLDVTDEDKENFVDEIETEVFAEFGEDYAAKYFKIQKSDEPFSKSISAVITRGEETVFDRLNNLTEWKANGLVLNQSQVESLMIQPNGRLYAINNINFADLENDIDRVTLERNIEAENVTFTPSPKMDILLMPGAQFCYSFTKYKDGIHTYNDGSETHSDFILKGDYLNFFWHVFDRQFWEEIIDIEESGLSLYQQSYRLWQIQKQFDNAKVIRLTYDFQETPPYSYHTTVTDEPVEDFPY